ncbi:terminase small subunit [Dickeya phage Katbat]|uniref:Terminase small subunit n=3 Tax=Aarhusvirus TaxID=2732675 RepID=A0A2S1GSM6_9CAUD|nr:terminase small subunit [Dickeya phage Dagda]YP_009811913.1 terminase small subunit [Dickeya phage Katbat]AWD92352.1 terminase small subunit [Dickeya phage Dagda]AXY81650.1 terminase small subunit [Dickeya phage Dagda_B1]AXY81762.1 terminase small subunit [Dickeya phage Katbat]
MSDKSLIKFLEMLDTNMAQQMLKDLGNEAKRTPQLYNAIGKLLERHKFQISKLQPDENILGGLADALTDYNKEYGADGLSEDEANGGERWVN